MKYRVGQKVQDKRDFIRGRIIDYFECSDTKYCIRNGISTFERLESELELIPEERVTYFIKRVCNFVSDDCISALVIFGLGVLGGVLL